MGLTSSGSGDDRLQVGMAVFVVVISLVVTMMIPIVAPAYNTDTGYSFAEIYAERASVEAFTGDSMTNMSPWMLEGVYTPWSVGDPVYTDDSGWVYGDSVNYVKDGYMGRTQIGSTNTIYLDPNQKSNTPLVQTTSQVTETVESGEWWAYGIAGNLTLFGFIADYLGWSTTHTTQKVTDVNSWTYTGYRYSFDPMLFIDWDDPNSGKYSASSQVDAKLSLIWYEDQYGQGLSSGLILWNDRTHGIVDNIEVSEIIASYNAASNYSSKYRFDFEGVQVYINIRFDQNVIASGMDLADAFDAGYWSMAITASSMDNFMSISSSNSLSNSAANIIETYTQIFTLSLPEVPFLWSIILWVICILPVEVVVLMFLSRFGILGVGMGILGSVLLSVGAFA